MPETAGTNFRDGIQSPCRICLVNATTCLQSCVFATMFSLFTADDRADDQAENIAFTDVSTDSFYFF